MVAAAAVTTALLVLLGSAPASATLPVDVSAWANTLASSLTTFNEEASAYSVLNNAFQSTDYESTATSATAAFDRLQSGLESKVAARNAALESLHTAATSVVTSSTSGGAVDQCCNVDAGEDFYNPAFKRGVRTDLSCVRFSHSITHASADQTTIAGRVGRLTSTYEAMHATTSTLKWTYFGSDTGVHSAYPAAPRSSCCDYDPKDIVVVIDSSGSMSSENRMSAAKAAANVVLSTLNPRDRVSVVDFDSATSQPTGCYATKMARATPENLSNLKNFVNNMQDGGGTSYNAAMNTAFEVLASTAGSSGNKRQAILFLSDGVPVESDDDILSNLSRLNPGREVSVLTFLLGDADAADVLGRMASENNGRFIEIPDGGDLRSAMGGYYQFFSEEVANQKPIWSAPYFDSSGLGLMTTAALPVYNSGSLAGVVGVDVTIEDLAAEVSFVGESSEKSYAFIIDSEGRAVMHPLMPSPSGADEPPLFMDIQQLETNAVFVDTVMPSMLARESGNRAATITRAISRGVTSTEGLRTITFPGTYVWGPIADSPFSVCLVFVDDNVASVDTVARPSDASDLVYHRVDVASSPGTLCNQFGSVSTTARSTVKMAPSSFANPVAYVEQRETSAAADDFTEWLQADDLGTTLPPVDMVDHGVAEKKDAWVTQAADDAYAANADEVMDLVAWRYVGTARGVFRTFPGHQSASTYDPRVRPWYVRSIANPQALAFSAPYYDASGAGVVITMSKAILQPGGSGAIEAVTGVDFTLGKFQEILDSASQCGNADYECVIVDSSGLIVLSNNVMLTEYDRCSTGVPAIALGAEFPAVAESLRAAGYLTENKCNDFQAKEQLRAWELDLEGTARSAAVSQCSFTIAPIGGTNAFLLVMDVDAGCGETVRSGTNTQTMEQTSMSTPSLYDVCDTEFTLTGDMLAQPTCPPSLSNFVATVIPPGSEGVSARTLDSCYDTGACNSITDEKACASAIGCAVCYDGNTFSCRSGDCDNTGNDLSDLPACPVPPLSGGGGSGDCSAPGAGAVVTPTAGVIVAVVVAGVLTALRTE